MACFAAACLFGAVAGNDLHTIIVRATWAMIVSYFLVGLGVGALMQRTIDAHMAEYKRRHPIPADEPAAGDVNAVADETLNTDNGPSTVVKASA